MMLIVTLQDGVEWHANNVFAHACGFGFKPSIETSTPDTGTAVLGKTIMRVIIRDHVAKVSAFPERIFAELPGVIRVETRNEPNP